MKFKSLLSLLKKATNECKNLNEAVITSQGYIFVFIDPINSNEPYVFTSNSSKLVGVGAYYRLLDKWRCNHDNIKDLDELCQYNEKFDCLFAGALKTLLPSLPFGGDERLFRSWMFVRTPDDEKFPATFYFGPSGTSIGAWESYNSFPSNFKSIINCSPFDFSKIQLEGLVNALELALISVPVSDFHAVYRHDLGNALMGVKSGIPFIAELGYTYDNIDIKIYLGEVEYDRVRKKFNDY